jgi:adenylate kinase family enzyme
MNYQEQFFECNFGENKTFPISIRELSFINVNEDNRVFLLGEPGVGKSRALREIGNWLGKTDYDDGYFLCDAKKIVDKNLEKLIEDKELYSLDSITDESIDIYKSFNFKLSKNSLILVDGLDEVSETEVLKVIYSIQELQENFGFFVVISCREYLFEKYKIQFEKFTTSTIKLRPLEFNQVVNTINKVIVSYDELILGKKLEKAGLLSRFYIQYKILNIPRYLKYFIELLEVGEISIDFIETITRVEIFNKIIDKRFNDEIRKKTELDKVHTLPQLKLLCERLALIMAIKDSNSITIDNYWEVVADTELSTIQLQINPAFIFNKAILKTDDKNIEFDNVELLEILAANAILKFESISQVVFVLSINSYINIPKSKWINILSYIVEGDINTGVNLFMYLLKYRKVRDLESIFRYQNFSKFSKVLPKNIFKIIMDSYENISTGMSNNFANSIANLVDQSVIEHVFEKVKEVPKVLSEYAYNSNFFHVLSFCNFGEKSPKTYIKIKNRAIQVLENYNHSNIHKSGMMYYDCVCFLRTLQLDKNDLLRLKGCLEVVEDNKIKKELILTLLLFQQDSNEIINLYLNHKFSWGHIDYTININELDIINTENGLIAFLKAYFYFKKNHKNFDENIRLNNLKDHFTKEVKRELLKLILDETSFKNFLWKTNFFEWLSNEIKPIDSHFVFSLLESFDIKLLKPSESYTDITVLEPFAYFLDLNNIERFIIESKKKFRNDSFWISSFIKNEALKDTFYSFFPEEYKRAILSQRMIELKDKESENLQNILDEEECHIRFERLLTKRSSKALIFVKIKNYNDPKYPRGDCQVEYSKYKNQINEIIFSLIKDINIDKIYWVKHNDNGFTPTSVHDYTDLAFIISIDNQINCSDSIQKIIVPFFLMGHGKFLKSIYNKKLSQKNIKVLIDGLVANQNTYLFQKNLYAILQGLEKSNLLEVLYRFDVTKILASPHTSFNGIKYLLEILNLNKVSKAQILEIKKIIDDGIIKDIVLESLVIKALINYKPETSCLEIYLKKIISYDKYNENIFIDDVNYFEDIISNLESSIYIEPLIKYLDISIKDVNTSAKINKYRYYKKVLWDYIFNYFINQSKRQNISEIHLNEIKGIYLHLRNYNHTNSFYSLKELFYDFFNSHFNTISSIKKIQHSIKRYKEIKGNKYLNILDLNDLHNKVGDILTSSMPDFIHSHGYDSLFSKDFKSEGNKTEQLEKFFQSLLPSIIENHLHKSGFTHNEIEIIPEYQNNTGSEKIDFYIKYGIIGSILIEVKLDSNTNNSSNKSIKSYLNTTIVEYANFSQVDYVFIYILKFKNNPNSLEKIINNYADNCSEILKEKASFIGYDFIEKRLFTK